MSEEKNTDSPIASASSTIAGHKRSREENQIDEISHETVKRPKLLVQRREPHAILPKRSSPGAAGYDLASGSKNNIIVPARGKQLIPTHLAVKIPYGTYFRIAPRSGLALNHFIDVGAGVCDFDYRGTIGIILFNHSNEDFIVKYGDRIAQGILEKIEIADVEEVQDLDTTDRQASGFGSTGI